MHVRQTPGEAARCRTRGFSGAPVSCVVLRRWLPERGLLCRELVRVDSGKPDRGRWPQVVAGPQHLLESPASAGQRRGLSPQGTSPGWRGTARPCGPSSGPSSAWLDRLGAPWPRRETLGLWTPWQGRASYHRCALGWSRLDLPLVVSCFVLLVRAAEGL